ncbi:MAG TPA: hypothetical protein VE258_03325 [Ktedonobacterales bacterium]|nr:hypothetical protein [Ktedonobacterales bacterium]
MTTASKTPADAIWHLLRAAAGVYGGCLAIIIACGAYDSSNDELNRSLCVAFAAVFSLLALGLLRSFGARSAAVPAEAAAGGMGAN